MGHKYCNLIFLSLICSVAAAGCSDEAQNASGERPGLSRSAGGHSERIERCDMSGDRRKGGLWLTVRNDLPVIRQDGNIISQTFLEAEVEAPDRSDLDNGRSGSSEPSDPHSSWRDTSSVSSRKLLLDGQILSESETTFWLSPRQLDALVEKSGGVLWFNIKDSVQVSTSPYMCWMSGSRAHMKVQRSSEATVQRLTLRVHGRYRLSYKCSLD